MPYDLPFGRINELSNELALEHNKRIAVELIAAFPEIHDLNKADSSAHFMWRKVDSEDEFPDKHFSLYAETGGMWFCFQFWKDVLWLELGAGEDVNTRFAQVCKYAAFITQHGFRINPSHLGETATLNGGLAWHMREYKEWVDFVEHVVKPMSTMPPTT